MKKIFRTTFIVLLTSVLFSDCKKEKQSEIILEYPLLFLEVMEIDTLNVDSLIIRESVDFPTNFEGDLAKNNTTKSKIKSAKLVFMRIQVADYAFDDTNNYCNLKDISEMQVDIKNLNVGQLKVASKNIPDSKVKAVNLDLSDNEGRDYLKQETFRFIFKYRKRRPMPHQMPFIISLRFRIVADPL